MSIDDRPCIYIYPLIGNSESNPLTNPNARAYIESRMNTYATSPLSNRVTIQEVPTSIPQYMVDKIKSCMSENRGPLTTPIGVINIDDHGKSDFIVIFKGEGIVNHDEYRFCIVREGTHEKKTSIPFKDPKECLEMAIQRWKNLKILSDAKSKPQPPLQKESASPVKPADSQRPTAILKEPDGTTTAAPESQPTMQDLRQIIEDGSEYAPDATRELKRLPRDSATQANEESHIFSILEGLAREDKGHINLKNDPAWKNWEKAKKIDAAISQAKERGQLLFVNVTRKNQTTLMTFDEATEYRNRLYKKTIDAVNRTLADSTRRRKSSRPKTDNNSEKKPPVQKQPSPPQSKEKPNTPNNKEPSSKEPNQTSQQMEAEPASKTKPSAPPSLSEQGLKGLLKEDTAKAFLLMQEHKRVGQLIDEASKSRNFVHLTVNGKSTRMTIAEARSYQESLKTQGAKILYQTYPQDKQAEKALEDFKKEMLTPKNQSQNNKPAPSNGPPSDPAKKDEPPTPKTSKSEGQPKTSSEANNKPKVSPPPTFLSKPASGPLKELQDSVKYASNKMDKAAKLIQQVDEARTKNQNYITVNKNGKISRLSLEEADAKQRTLVSKAINTINREAYKPRTPRERIKASIKNSRALNAKEFGKNGANSLGSALGAAFINRDKYVNNTAMAKDIAWNTVLATGMQFGSQLSTDIATSVAKEYAPKIADNIPGASTLLTLGHYSYAICKAQNMEQRGGLIMIGILDTGFCFFSDVATTALCPIPGVKGLLSGTINAGFRRYLINPLYKEYGIEQS